MRQLFRSGLAVLISAALTASSLATASAGVVFQGGTAVSGGGAGAGAAGAVQVRQGFLSELNYSLDALNSLTLAPLTPSVDAPTPQAPEKLSPEAAVLFMTSLAATPAAREEHEARQVLIEYIGRPQLRAEVEAALQSPEAAAAGGAETVKKLSTLKKKLEQLDKKEGRELLKGLVSLRKKLYTGTSKRASVGAARTHLSRLFDSAAKTSGKADAVGAEAAGRSLPKGSLLKPAGQLDKGEKRSLIDLSTLDTGQLDPRITAAISDQGAIQGVADVASMVLANYIRPVTPQKLMIGLQREARINGVAVSDADPGERRSSLDDLTEHLQRLIRSPSVESLGGVTRDLHGFIYAVAHHFIHKGVTPIFSAKDLTKVLKSVVHQTHDRYSTFMDPEETQQFKRRMSSSYAGIGIELDLEDKGEGVLIKRVVEDGPAEKAGVQDGDRVIEVDGEPLTDNKDYTKIAGKPGSKVSITVLRGGKRIKIEAVRKVMPAPPHVFASMIPGKPGVGYLHFSSFNQDTGPLVAKELAKLKEQGMKSLVLDLRFNGGGALPTANMIANLFLPRGRVIEYVQEGLSERKETTRMDGPFTDIPLAVLVNRYSASASEVLSGALQDNGRAKIVGENSFGKGVGQFPIPIVIEGIYKMVATIYLTTLKWLTPKRTWVHEETADGKGIKPDVRLTTDKDGYKAAGTNIGHGLRNDGKWDPASDPWIMRAAHVASKEKPGPAPKTAPSPDDQQAMMQRAMALQGTLLSVVAQLTGLHPAVLSMAGSVMKNGISLGDLVRMGEELQAWNISLPEAAWVLAQELKHTRFGGPISENDKPTPEEWWDLNERIRGIARAVVIARNNIYLQWRWGFEAGDRRFEDIRLTPMIRRVGEDVMIVLGAYRKGRGWMPLVFTIDSRAAAISGPSKVREDIGLHLGAILGSPLLKNADKETLRDFARKLEAEGLLNPGYSDSIGD